MMAPDRRLSVGTTCGAQSFFIVRCRLFVFSLTLSDEVMKVCEAFLYLQYNN